jgi:hypothetical protein
MKWINSTIYEWQRGEMQLECHPGDSINKMLFLDDSHPHILLSYFGRMRTFAFYLLFLGGAQPPSIFLNFARVRTPRIKQYFVWVRT